MKWHATHSLTCLLTLSRPRKNKKLKQDMPPSKQLSYAHTYLDTQCHKYHHYRLLIWAGCSFILIIFKTKFHISLLCCNWVPTPSAFCTNFFFFNPIFLTESTSQKLGYIYGRGAIHNRICSSNLATSYGINMRKSSFFHSLTYNCSKETERAAKN